MEKPGPLDGPALTQGSKLDLFWITQCYPNLVAHKVFLTIPFWIWLLGWAELGRGTWTRAFQYLAKLQPNDNSFANKCVLP